MTNEGFERKENREMEEAARINDKRAALAVCREIRDNPKSAAADRIEAIKIIHRMTRE